jgi:phosphatidate cytidylyltransferase
LPQVLFLILLVNGIAMILWVRRPERLPRFPAVFGQQMLGLIYIYFPLFYLFMLREQRHGLLFFLIYSVAIGDSGAYFFGKAFGKHKIYPVASPKKSLEGFIAALICAGVFAVGGYYLFGLTDFSLAFIILSGVLLALLSQLADPLESLFKRFAGVKDSGSLIPGHGGILDRIDSYLLCAPAFYFWIQWFS